MRQHRDRPATCEVPRCRRPAAINFLGRGVCDPCWSRYMGDGYQTSDVLRRKLGLALNVGPAPAAAKGRAFRPGKLERRVTVLPVGER